MSSEPKAPQPSPPGEPQESSATSIEHEPSQFCPRCGSALQERHSKWICARCGYSMSCSDFV